MASSINASTSGAGGVITTADNTGILNLQTASTTAVTVDASQNVGIGTTSPLSRLQVKAEGQNFGDGYILEKSSGTIMYNQVIGSDNALYLGYSSDSGSSFSSRMVMDSSGNLQFNSGYGSVTTAYGCRAWVNFNGTGTVAIRASGNVSSITDNGVGQYTVNFTTAMPDANYNVTGSCGTDSGVSALWITNGSNVGSRTYNNTTTTCIIQSAFATSSLADAVAVNVAVFR